MHSVRSRDRFETVEYQTANTKSEVLRGKADRSCCSTTDERQRSAWPLAPLVFLTVHIDYEKGT